MATIGSTASVASSQSTTDPDSADIVTLDDIQIAPDPSAKSTETKAADLYLGLNSAGQVVKVYYAVPLDNLGNNDISYDLVLKDSDFINTVLSDAGTGVSDSHRRCLTRVPMPLLDEFNGGQTLTKCTYAYSGQTTLAQAPTAWQITFTYDYIGSSVTKASDVTRFMYVKLL